MKILVTDDHPLFREGTAAMLLQLEPGVQILEAGTLAEACNLLDAQPDVDLVLLDLRLPDASGLEALESLVGRYSTLPIVVISGSEERSDIRRALDAGAMGFLPKSESHAVLLNALRLVMAGGIYLPPVMLADTSASVEPPGQRDNALTPRQREVLSGVMAGKPNKIIASELGLSEATVKAHVTAVFRTLKVTNRTQAVIAAKSLGLAP